MSPPTSREREFAAYLAGLVERENRAVLAALRRGLGKRPGQVAELFPYVVPWLLTDGAASEDEAYYLVAALFAGHQIPWMSADDEVSARPTWRHPNNLGASFRRMARDEGVTTSVESRFVALLSCDHEDLPVHLRHAVGLLKAKGIPIDWAQLLHDVQAWEDERRYVQQEWARAYWAEGQPVDEADTETRHAQATDR